MSAAAISKNNKKHVEDYKQYLLETGSQSMLKNKSNTNVLKTLLKNNNYLQYKVDNAMKSARNAMQSVQTTEGAENVLAAPMFHTLNNKELEARFAEFNQESSNDNENNIPPPPTMEPNSNSNNEVTKALTERLAGLRRQPSNIPKIPKKTPQQRRTKKPTQRQIQAAQRAATRKRLQKSQNKLHTRLSNIQRKQQKAIKTAKNLAQKQQKTIICQYFKKLLNSFKKAFNSLMFKDGSTFTRQEIIQHKNNEDYKKFLSTYIDNRAEKSKFLKFNTEYSLGIMEFIEKFKRHTIFGKGLFLSNLTIDKKNILLHLYIYVINKLFDSILNPNNCDLSDAEKMKFETLKRKFDQKTQQVLRNYTNNNNNDWVGISINGQEEPIEV